MAKKTFIPSKEVKERISNWEGIAMLGPSIDPLSKKLVKLNNSFENEADLFYSKIPQELRDKILSNQELADNLYSYSYNVGSGNFEKRVVPALINYYNNKGTAQAVLDSMYAKGDSKLDGLKKRREYEKELVRKNLPPQFTSYTEQSHTEHPDALRTNFPTIIEPIMNNTVKKFKQKIRKNKLGGLIKNRGGGLANFLQVVSPR